MALSKIFLEKLNETMENLRLDVPDKVRTGRLPLPLELT
jgi:hypothetical protein